MTTALDDLVDELAGKVDQLPTRAKSALFWALAHGLLSEFEQWAQMRDPSVMPLLEEALRSAESFAVTGERGADTAALLDRLESNVPDGEYLEGADATAAQDCWICADSSIRVQMDSGFEAGPCIEYALEPLLQSTTERLFGVSQVGSGESEAEQIDAILRNDFVVVAVDYCRWAIATLSATTDLEQVLDQLKARAVALSP